MQVETGDAGELCAHVVDLVLGARVRVRVSLGSYGRYRVYRI